MFNEGYLTHLDQTNIYHKLGGNRYNNGFTITHNCIISRKKTNSRWMSVQWLFARIECMRFIIKHSNFPCSTVFWWYLFCSLISAANPYCDFSNRTYISKVDWTLKCRKTTCNKNHNKWTLCSMFVNWRVVTVIINSHHVIQMCDTFEFNNSKEARSHTEIIIQFNSIQS